MLLFMLRCIASTLYSVVAVCCSRLSEQDYTLETILNGDGCVLWVFHGDGPKDSFCWGTNQFESIHMCEKRVTAALDQLVSPLTPPSYDSSWLLGKEIPLGVIRVEIDTLMKGAISPSMRTRSCTLQCSRNQSSSPDRNPTDRESCIKEGDSVPSKTCR